MAFVLADRVLETSTSTGTGALTLAGAEPGYRTFSSAIGDGNDTFYCIRNRAVLTEYELGIGAVSAGLLTRTTPLKSSNADAAVVFSAGTKDVFCTHLADRTPYIVGTTVVFPNAAKVPPASVSGGKHSVFIPAAGMVSRITAGAQYSQTETGTNHVQLAGFLFDGTTQEHVQFYMGAPKGWNKGTIVARFMFAPTTTVSQATRWEIAAQARGDGDALENAFGTAVGVDTSHTTANQVELSASTSAMTVGSTPVTDDLLVFQVSRAPANAGDTYTADALLLGVWLDFTYDAVNDD